MKSNVDLTDGEDFRDRQSEPRIALSLWDEMNAMDKVLRSSGALTFPTHDIDFPPKCICERCGRLIPPWIPSGGLCKKCKNTKVTQNP